jgi:hypothetical protein
MLLRLLGIIKQKGFKFYGTEKDLKKVVISAIICS